MAAIIAEATGYDNSRMKIHIVVDDMIDTTDVKGGVFTVTLRPRGLGVARLYAYDDEGRVLGGVYLAVGTKGGFSVAAMRRR